MTAVVTAAEVLIILLAPLLILKLTKKFPVLHSIGPITLCYALGFIISLIPVNYDKDLSQTVASVLVAVAIPLVLFSFDITEVRRLAGKTIVGFVLICVSVITVSTAAAAIAYAAGNDNAAALAGMSTGLYIGGTPNLFAVGSAMVNDSTIINLANISDSVVGGIYFLLILTVLKNVYCRFLGKRKYSRETSGNDVPDAAAAEYDFSIIPRDRKSILKLCGSFLLAAVCLGIGVGIEILINGNMDGSLYIMITVSVLGIVFSLIRPVREIRGSYQCGQYLILAFSLGLSMSIDFSKLVSGILPTLIFFTVVQLSSAMLHLILCKLFHVDGGTALVTSTAGIYGPPFIAPVADALGDRSLIAPGVICGTSGLMIGNLLGIGLGTLLKSILH